MKVATSLLLQTSSLVVLLIPAIRTAGQSDATAFTSIVLRAEEDINSNIVVARGRLNREGPAGTLWTLRPDNAPKIRGEAIVQLTFSAPAGKTSHAFDAYAGNWVELTGEVKSVDRGKAVLSKVRTIGLIGPSFQISATAGFSHSLQKTEPQANPDAVSAAVPAGRIPYRHAYYLFLASAPHGCESCYIPLLITQDSLEEIAQTKDDALVLFLITFERDSLWEFRGAAVAEPAAIHVQSRDLVVNGRNYRYQEIVPGEVVKLLENPLGTIPISRPFIQNKAVPGASLPELIADFRALGESPASTAK